jgi:hybrid cluster-associated redox disulfide protein
MISKEINIAELVHKYPAAEEILLDYGLHCVGCFASSFDTLEAGAMIHGILEEELEEMVTRINEVISHGE